jgi:hypothetical protein
MMQWCGSNGLQRNYSSTSAHSIHSKLFGTGFIVFRSDEVERGGGEVNGRIKSLRYSFDC